MPSTTTRRSRSVAAWPTNAAAYTTVITGAVPLTGAGLVLAGAPTPEAVGATVIALLSHLAVLHATPRWAKILLSWLGTVIASVALAATSYEGEPGLTWSGIAQWDTSDLAILALLVMGNLVHTFVPNALPRYATVAGEVVGTHDIPDPVLDPTDGDPVAFATESTVLTALTQEQIDEHAGRHDAAATLPAPAPAPEVEQLEDAGRPGYVL